MVSRLCFHLSINVVLHQSHYLIISAGPTANHSILSEGCLAKLTNLGMLNNGSHFAGAMNVTLHILSNRNKWGPESTRGQKISVVGNAWGLMYWLIHK